MMKKLRRQLPRVLLAAALPVGLAAQEPPEPFEPEPPIIEQQSGPDVLFGLDLLVGIPVGEFDEHVGAGGGIAGHTVLALPGGPFGLRFEASGLIYGSETYSTPLSDTGGRVWIDVTTQNWIGGLAAGPQLMRRSGNVRPYLHALAGFSYFSTTSEARDESDSEPFATTTNFDDFTFSWRFGGGLLIPLGSSPVSLDIGVRYQINGSVEYLAEGDLHDDGESVYFTPRRSEANLVEFRLGVSFGR